MKQIVMAGVGLAVLAASVSAQQPVLNARVAAASSAKFQIALCSVKSDNSRTNDGGKALRESLDEKDPGKRAKVQSDGQKLLLEALAKNPQDGGAWYFLGRLGLMRGDLVMADTSFRKAQASRSIFSPA